ncbi:MAG TPA: ribosome rescue protein RqcH [archaeon]|nr:ribosome rescue protein RqcH [archaeon]
MEELQESKNEMSSFDIKFIIEELKGLNGGVIRKIYQYKVGDNYQFLFEVSTVQGPQWLMVDKSKIFLTKYKKEAPLEPPSFCMFLRKHLANTRIKNISQRDFDRIVEIETENNFLILELFSKGNVILCDSFHNIIMPLEMQLRKDREIKSKLGYKYPVSCLNPFKTDLSEFRKIFHTQSKKIIVVLATTFGLGKQYSKELCVLSGLDENKMSIEIKEAELEKLYYTILEFGKRKPSPSTYLTFVSPIELISEKLKPKKYPTLSEAFDEFFLKSETARQKVEESKKSEEVQKKIDYIRMTQEKNLERLDTSVKQSKEAADLIYTNYQLISSVITTIKKALQSGKKWPEIKDQLKHIAEVKSVNEHKGEIVLNLSGQEVEIDFNKSIEQNAEQYYETAKKSKRKLEGVKEAIEQEPKIEKPQPEEKPVRKERKKWYEKFKWFFTSSDFLVIAGRNENQNESIVKKHAEKDDFLLHADIHGAAFVLVKAKEGTKQIGKDLLPSKTPIDGIAMKEAAEFSAANSKAWSKGIGAIDVSAFRPEQATKPDGSLAKGSFVIQGQRIWFKDMELKLSIGIKVDKEKSIAKVISGPVMAVRKHSNYFVTIQPGYKDSFELSREIKNKILQKSKPEDRFFIEKIQNSDIQACIPSGRGEVVE